MFTFFVSALLKEYKKNNINYCILRNYEYLPEKNVSSDIDFLIDRKQIKLNEQILFKLKEIFKIEQLVKIKRQYVTIYCFKKAADNFYLKIDFITDEQFRGAVFLAGEEILNHRRVYKDFYIPSEAHEALIYFINFVLGRGKLKETYKDKIINVLNTDSNLFKVKIGNLVGKNLSNYFINLFMEKNFYAILNFKSKSRFILWVRLFMNSPFGQLYRLMMFIFVELKQNISKKLFNF